MIPPYEEFLSYPKIYNLGHREIRDLLTSPVVVQEKVDGSQISFQEDSKGDLRIRLNGSAFRPENPPKLFSMAVETIIGLHENGKLSPGFTYRGEAVCTPRHNVLTYERIPRGGLILFDIDCGNQDYCTPQEVERYADELDLEVVPTFYEGMLETYDQLQELLHHPSHLGGAIVEGIVIKNYKLFGMDKKALMAKVVRDSFREAHKIAWKKPAGENIIEAITKSLKTEARWQKAVIHFKEKGLLTDSPKDIGPLLKEISADILGEEESNIRDALFKWAWKPLSKEVTRGFPEWYKDQLVKQQFAAAEV